MLRITTTADELASSLKLEGRLTSQWISELERCWRDTPRQTGRELLVDLRSVTYIDAAGKDLLFRMHLGGARFLAAGPMTQGIVDEVQAEAAANGSLHL
jgi:hypothetical protein